MKRKLTFPWEIHASANSLVMSSVSWCCFHWSKVPWRLEGDSGGPLALAEAVGSGFEGAGPVSSGKPDMSGTSIILAGRGCTMLLLCVPFPQDSNMCFCSLSLVACGTGPVQPLHFTPSHLRKPATCCKSLVAESCFEFCQAPSEQYLHE